MTHTTDAHHSSHMDLGMLGRRQTSYTLSHQHGGAEQLEVGDGIIFEGNWWATIRARKEGASTRGVYQYVHVLERADQVHVRARTVCVCACMCERGYLRHTDGGIA
jgi:hypothetical protein